MDVKKLDPWNWFKKEEEQNTTTVPVQRSGGVLQYSPITHFHHEIDRVFDNYLRSFGFPSIDFGRGFAPMAQRDWLKPTLDVAASDKEYTITVELPGVDERDIQLELLDDTLKIKGEKKSEKEEKNKNYYRMERSYGSFQRVLSLPEDAEQQGIGAFHKKGILTITIPRKARAATKSQRISINNA